MTAAHVHEGVDDHGYRGQQTNDCCRCAFLAHNFGFSHGTTGNCQCTDEYYGHCIVVLLYSRRRTRDERRRDIHVRSEPFVWTKILYAVRIARSNKGSRKTFEKKRSRRFRKATTPRGVPQIHRKGKTKWSKRTQNAIIFGVPPRET